MPRAQRVHPGRAALAPPRVARLGRGQPLEVQDLEGVPVRDEAEIVDSHRSGMDVGREPVHLVLLLVDVVGAERRERQRT